MMCFMQFFISLSLVVLSIHNYANASPRIVGGTPVTNFTEFSYQVSVQYDGAHICGGSIIHERHILTAAHCCVDANGKKKNVNHYSIGYGDVQLRKLKKINVKHIFVHEDFNYNTVVNDIAILRLEKNLTNWSGFDSALITLASRPVADSIPCKTSGWGVLNYGSNRVSSNLMQVELLIYNKAECNKKYELSDTMICAYSENKDSCQGDSGGPLVCNNHLTGIVSTGYKCAIATFPGIYTEVAKYESWILQQFTLSSSITTSSRFIVIFVNLFCSMIYSYFQII